MVSSDGHKRIRSGNYIYIYIYNFCLKSKKFRNIYMGPMMHRTGEKLVLKIFDISQMK